MLYKPLPDVSPTIPNSALATEAACHSNFLASHLFWTKLSFRHRKLDTVSGNINVLPPCVSTIVFNGLLMQLSETLAQLVGGERHLESMDATVLH